MTEIETSELPAILMSRWRDLRDLLELSRRQLQIIEEDDYTQLLAIQGQKQRLLARLEEWKTANPDMRDTWRAARDEMDVDLRERCEAILNGSEELITQLLEEEQISTDRLKEKRDETQQQLQVLAHGNRLLNAYRQATTGRESKHLDLNT